MLRRREVQKVEPDKRTAEKLLAVAGEDLTAARDNIKINHSSVALTLAYHAMLNAGRALMSAKGYRAYSEAHHKSVVQFCGVVFQADSSRLVNLFNHYRVRRHDVVYGEVDTGSVGKNEAENAVKAAEEFLEKVKKMV